MRDFGYSGDLAGRIYDLRSAEVATASAEELSELATSDQFGVTLELTLSARDSWTFSDHHIRFVDTVGTAAKPDERDACSGSEFSFYLPDTALVTPDKRTEEIEVYMTRWGGTLTRQGKALGPYDRRARLERFKLWIAENPEKSDYVKEAILDQMYTEGFLYLVQMRLHDWLEAAAESLKGKIAL